MYPYAVRRPRAMASDLPVDLLEEIFLRLDDVADLARASAACMSFHGVVSNSRFLRRFRSLHGRPVLGLLLDKNCHSETGLFYPAQPPRCSAPAAAGFAKAADFTFSFLPDSSHWRVCDARDGRVLLIRGRPGRSYMFKDLVAYDPLHRRHVQIPTIHGDKLLLGSNEAMTFDDPFLAPAVAEDERDDDESSSSRFRVMCSARSKTKVVALVFSSTSGQWRCGASFSMSTHLASLCFRQYVHSCFCWAYAAANVMLVFDTREMKFSISDLPNDRFGKLKMPVEAGDGRLGLLLVSNNGGTRMDLYSKAWRGNGVIQELEEEWRHDSSIPMPGFHLTLTGTAEGYVLLRGRPQDQHDELCIGTYKKEPEEHYFTLDLKTLLVEKLCVLGCDSRPNFLYASFPPPFSRPSV